ncbi:MAG TPA: hypothetical protein VNA16_11450 [Abditibacteriaceae bacterium]|nr:hypothetical protein [Abditibacteriaceae bacterium]
MATSATKHPGSVKKRTAQKPVPPKKSKPSRTPIAVAPEAAKAHKKIAGRVAATAPSQTANRAKSQPPRAQRALAIAAGAAADSSVKVRSRRPRAPKDLAEQYTEKTKQHRKIKTQETTVAQPKRRDAAARERLRQVMMPTDDVVRRLAQAGAIAASSLVMDEGATSVQARRRVTVTARRPRRWETRCGKCGTNGQFKAAAGLCARCGAIVVRDGIGV